MKIYEITRNIICMLLAILYLVLFFAPILSLASIHKIPTISSTSSLKAIATVTSTNLYRFVKIYPKFGETINSTSVKLSWSLSELPKNSLSKRSFLASDKFSYFLYFSDSSSPTLYASNIANSYYLISHLKPHTCYYWRIMAENKKIKFFSPIYHFAVKNTLPSKPILLYPKNNATCIATSTTLRWSKYVGLDNDKIFYDLYLSSNSTPTLYATNLKFPYFKIDNIDAHTKFYWKIIAKDLCGGIASSDVHFFTTSNNLPHIYLKFPKNKSHGIYSLSLTLTWDASDIDGDKLTYDLYLSSDPTPTIYATNISATKYTLHNLVGHTSYYWRVLVKDGFGAKIFSPIHKFTTEDNFPSISLIHPKYFTTNIPTTSLTLTWDASDIDGDKLTYDLYLSSDPTPTIYATNISATKYTLHNLDSYKKYYWKVFADDHHGMGIFSKTYSFITEYSNCTIKWRFKMSNKNSSFPYWIQSSPAIASDGTIYIESNDHYLYAISPDGRLKWRFKMSNKNSSFPYWIQSSPAIASNGTIYIGSNDHYLYAINPDGRLKWKFKTKRSIQSSPAIASDGTIYIGSNDHYLYAINPDGRLKWKFKTSNIINSSPAIGHNGAVYTASIDNYLYAINPDGRLKWKFKTNNYIDSSPSVGRNETIYVADDKGYFYSINYKGFLNWNIKLNSRISSSPAIASDGTIYIGSDDGNLYAIYPTGILEWKYQTKSYVNSSPAIASDGTIYIGSDDGNLYAISPDGRLKWSYKTDGDISSSPAIASDGTIYIGSNDGNLYSILDHNKGNFTNFWSCFRGNTYRTGKIK